MLLQFIQRISLLYTLGYPTQYLPTLKPLQEGISWFYAINPAVYRTVGKLTTNFLLAVWACQAVSQL